MRDTKLIVLAVLAVALVFAALSSTFIVQQTEQALVLRFGEPVAGRGLVSEPGLHFKLPFVETVIPIDKRILDLETPNQEVLASDNTRIQVDAFLRYKIVDPLRFYQTVQSIERANGQLGYVMNSAIRRVLGEADLTQIVRDDRSGLMLKIRDQMNEEVQRLGINAVDVRIRRADLPRQISEQVFARMRSERDREAAEYRAQGVEQAAKITAKAKRDVVVLIADAQQQADQTKGEGDATRNQIFAEAFGRDPDFFQFYRTMDAYDSALAGANTRFVVSPAGDFFRYLKTPNPTAPAKPPEAPADRPSASR